MSTPITEKLLIGAGGWPVMKAARALVAMDRVMAVTYEPPHLRGTVREGQTEWRSGLKIESPTRVENLCTCRESRQFGKICAHSIAVGLRWIAPSPAPQVPPVAQPIHATPKPADEMRPRFQVGPTGEMVALTVLLPPQLAPNAPSVAVKLEASYKNRIIPLGALPAATAEYCCDAADLALISGLRALTGLALPGAVVLPMAQFLALLASLAGHPRILLARRQTLAVAAEPIRLPLTLQNTVADLAVRVTLPAEGALFRAANETWLLTNHRFAPIAPGLPAHYAALFEGEVVIPAAHRDSFLAAELPLLRTHFEVDAALAEPAVGRPTESKTTLLIEGSLNHLTARLNPDSRGAAEELRAAGFAGPDRTGHFILRGERHILGFFAGAYPRWQKMWDVSLGARCTKVLEQVEVVRPQFEVQPSGADWFDLQIELGTESGQRFSRAEIQRLLASGQRHTRLKNQKIAIFAPEMLDELDGLLRDADPQQIQPGRYRVAQRQAGFVVETAGALGAKLGAPKNWSALATIQDPASLPPVSLGHLEEILRPYQKQGVAWLSAIGAAGQGGLLADEMGLGKTLQMLAFIQASGGPALIICPSSLVFNWKNEAAKWVPQLSCVAIEGAQRAPALAKLGEASITITSYALLRRDLASYQPVRFRTLVLDEAQHIKNPDAQNTQVAQAIRAAHRFVLTGTPIENSARDLWSLMNFALPGYLGERDDFMERYGRPLAEGNDPALAARLRRRIRPFLLRRTKKEVTPELPDKVEQVAYCELTNEQSDLYQAILKTARERAAEKSPATAGQRRFQMLTFLLRLRQVCCDPRLLDPESKQVSAKLELLAELLSEALDGGHRILLFSQFTTMLDLIESRLIDEEIAFCRLDGSTKNREQVVAKFKTDPSIPVFLISLKAGGSGLNLAEADTVIHFDPWWNPSVEAQATDRAHRLGQEKTVTSYKLIARGTVEEKILQLQEKKRTTAAGLLRTEAAFTEALSAAELEALLA